MSDQIMAIARAVKATGGRALVVGGFVRDRLLGLPSKDIDIEVLGLDLEELETLLCGFGRVIRVGRSFDVLRIAGLNVDFSAATEPTATGLSYDAAARRRDLTVNSMALDPLTEEVLDPHGGQRDLEAHQLRATDPDQFGADPLRAVRVAQFIARFEMSPDPELVALCTAQDLSSLPGERLFEELRKLLLQSARPSQGLEFLRQTRLIRFLPELGAMIETPQDPEWHPEGDVWRHTLMVVDQAAALRQGDDDDLALMLAALCHDIGKPLCTMEEEGRIKSPRHDKLGIAPTQRLLERLRTPKQLVARVSALVEHHLAPALFIKNGAKARGYRRLAHRLEKSGVSIELLARMARADHFGRATPDALAGEFPAGDLFLIRAAELEIEQHGQTDVVRGRHLIARGLTPGRSFGEILRRCREVQDECGERDPDRILDRVL